MPELQAAVNTVLEHPVRLSTAKGPFRELLTGGEVVAFPAGRATEYTASSVHGVSLRQLLQLADEAVDPDRRDPPGRRTRVDGSRAVERITKKQHERMWTVARKVTRHLYPGAPADQILAKMEQVGSPYFVWDPRAGDGENGDWRLWLELVAAASSPGTRDQDVGTGRQLLDLAASHGLIGRTARHDESYQPVPPHWSSLYAQWRTALSGGNNDSTSSSLMRLLEGCARVGMTDPAGAPSEHWSRVIDEIDTLFDSEGTDAKRRYGIRKTYNELVGKKLIEGKRWKPAAGRNALQLVATRYCHAVAAAYGIDGPQPALRETAEAEEGSPRWGDWPWPGFEGLSGLVEGAYGLRRAIVHFTAPADVADEYDVPHRGVYPGQPIRGTSGFSARPWREATVELHLQRLLTYAGWVARERRIDFSAPGSDLRVLLAEDHLLAFRRDVLTRGVLSKNSLERIIKGLAQLASPFCEAVALTQDHEATALAMARVSALLSSPRQVDGKPSWARQLRNADRENQTVRRRRKAQHVEKSWTDSGNAARDAYEQLERIRDEALRQLEEMAGRTIAEQLHALESGSWKPTRAWARAVQDVLYWADQLVVPLRVSTSVKLLRSMRKESLDLSRGWAEIPARVMKSEDNGDFDGVYWTSAPSRYPRDLYRLFVARGGARQILRTDVSGRQHPTDFFYVPDVQHTDSLKLSADAFRAIVVRMVEACEPALSGVSIKGLKGALGTHFFRHAFGTRMVRAGLLDVAALYLHHADLTMLRRVYSAATAGNFDAGALIAARS